MIMEEKNNLSGTDEAQVISLGVQYTSLHYIDHDKDEIIRINIDSKSQDLHEYTERLLKDIQERNSKRSFSFESMTTEVRAALTLMNDEDYETAVDITAERLLNVEKKTQIAMNQLGVSIQKGSLFQSIINVDENSRMIIIGKADHNDFLDAADFILHKGLPWKKKIFKSFLAITDYNDNIKKVMVSDTTNVLTKYWWSDFFELSEVRTNKHNTKHFLEIIDKKVLNPIKKDYPADHTTLRNSIIGHFRANEDFDLDVLYSSIFENYTPRDENLPIDSMQTKIKEIPDKYDLDSQFTIDKEEINKRAVNKIFLNEGMELVLTGAPNLDDIDPYEDSEGEKFILIKTEEGYKRFKK